MNWEETGRLLGHTGRPPRPPNALLTDPQPVRTGLYWSKLGAHLVRGLDVDLDLLPRQRLQGAPSSHNAPRAPLTLPPRPKIRVFHPKIPSHPPRHPRPSREIPGFAQNPRFSPQKNLDFDEHRGGCGAFRAAGRKRKWRPRPLRAQCQNTKWRVRHFRSIDQSQRCARLLPAVKMAAIVVSRKLPGFERASLGGGAVNQSGFIPPFRPRHFVPKRGKKPQKNHQNAFFNPKFCGLNSR